MIDKILRKIQRFFLQISNKLGHMQRKFRLSLDKIFYLDDKMTSVKKIKLADNKPLTDSEYARVEKLCDIFTAISNTAEKVMSPPEGGIFWSLAKKGNGPFDLHLRKDRNEIDHSFLFNTRFRDFPGIAYELDQYTPKPDFWVRRYIRLRNAVPKKWQVKVPARFGEIGWDVEGYPVNRLTSINQERINAMLISGVGRYLEQQTAPKIMEIGAGSGEMGYTLCKALPNATWYDCDLLGSLVYSTIHLAILLPEKNHYIYVGDLDLPPELDESFIIRSAAAASILKNAVVNIPNFLIQDFVGHLQLHMACNTYSFAEMPQSAVEEYTAALSNMLKDHGVLFEQNGYLFEKDKKSVEDVLLQKFEYQNWSWSFDYGPIKLSSGPMRTWTNNEKTKALYSKISNYNVYKIINSLDDNQDVVDIDYPPIIWDAVSERFPNCVH
jgi:hypothetical protein